VVLGVNEKPVRSGEAPHHQQRLVHDQLPGHHGQGLDDKSASSAAFMTTVHSYTNDQPIHDFPHKDLRRGAARARSA